MSKTSYPDSKVSPEAAILQAAPTAFLQLDTERLISEWNQAAEVLFGWPRANILGHPLRDILPSGLHETPGPGKLEVTALRRDGTEFPAELTVVSLSRSDRNPLALFVRELGVTERLAELEVRFRNLLEHIQDGYFEVDLKGRYTFLNEAGLRHKMGYTPQELLGVCYKQLYSPEVCANLKTAFSRVYSSGQPLDGFSQELEAKDGTKRCFEISITLRRNRAGQPIGFACISRDVTERKQAELTLQASEEKFRLIAENVREVFWIVSTATSQVLYVSPAYEQIWGQTRERLYQNPLAWTDSIHPQDRERVRAQFKQQLDGQTYDSEYRILTAEPGEKWIRDRSFLVRDASGHVVRIVGIAEDISDRKRQEAQLIQTNEALRESETQFRSLVEGAPDAIFVESRGEFCYVNPAACRLLGAQSPEMLLGQPVLDRVPPPSRALVAERLKSLRQDKQPLPTVERVWLGLDGHEIPVDVTAVAIKFQGRDCALVFARDISKRKEVESHTRHLEIMAAEAQAENRAKSSFLSVMSHEIRTPMNAILGYSQLLQRDPSLGPDAREHLKIIGRSGEHLLALIDDVLDMSKIEAGRTELSEDTFDLPRLLDDLAAMFRLRAAAKGLQFKLLTTGGPSYVFADEGKIRQVLINLLGNAVKFTAAGQIALQIAVGAGPGGGLWLNAEVSDTGEGIPEEEQIKLFLPFSQTKRGINLQGGTGLGLAISRKFARLMRGDISVSSKVGAGSVFRFQIPIMPGEAQAVVLRQTPLRVKAIRAGQQAPRILVADDHAENRNWLIKLLASVGFNVRGVDDGEAAIRCFADWDPQLILMDVHMPVMDGLKATRTIKDLARGKDTIVVVLTASVLGDDRRAAAVSGADDFLTKPCLEDDLLEKLRVRLNIVYDYEEIEGSGEQPGDSVKPLSVQRLGTLPRALVEEIRHATTSGNKRMLDQLLLRVSELGDDESARGLQELADKYDYDALIQVVDEVCR